MKPHLKNATECLRANKSLGISASKEPIQSNLHNAIAELISAVEEERAARVALEKKVEILESQIRNMPR